MFWALYLYNIDRRGALCSLCVSREVTHSSPASEAVRARASPPPVEAEHETMVSTRIFAVLAFGFENRSLAWSL